MLKKIINILILIILSFFAMTNISLADENAKKNILEFIRKDITKIMVKKGIPTNKEFIIDISNLKNSLDANFIDYDFSIHWDLNGKKMEGENFKYTFTELGDILISLKINYKEKKDNSPEKLIFSKDFNSFIFEKSVHFIVSDKIEKTAFESFAKVARKSGLYIYNKAFIKHKNIEILNILNNIDKYDKTGGIHSDYIAILGDKDFIIDFISKLNREINLSEKEVKYNMLMLSTSNIDILQNYLENFLGNKTWIGKMLLTRKSTIYSIIDTPISIEKIEKGFKEAKGEYKNIEIKKGGIKKIFFISNFINTLSNKGFSTNSIYIIILVPFLFTFISFFKHFIGISPIGISAPVFLVLIYFKLGLIMGISLFLLIIIFNIIFGKLFAKENLLYTPKISLVLTLNILLIILVTHLLDSFGFSVGLADALYFIMFIIVSDRLINVVFSKEINEYKKNLFFTIIITLLAYFIFSSNIIKVFLLAYPEIIILLIPFDYLLGKFTGLRITEYLRFREIIKNIEE